MEYLSDEDLGVIDSQYSTAGIDTSFGEFVTGSIAEGFQASPAYQLYEYAKTKPWEEDTMNASEANKLYGIEGTPVAFKEGEAVNKAHAEHVSNKYLDDQIWEAKKQQVSEDYGSITTGVTNFMGNLAGGMLDPINLAMGVGAGAAMRKMGMYTAESIAKDATITITKQMARQHTMQTARMAFAENLVTNTATEYSFGKLAEYANNKEVTTKDRLFGIMAGTVLGTGIQAGLTGRQLGRLVKHEDIKANALNESHGANAVELMDKTAQHAINAEANGVRPNHEFVQQKMDIELYSTRRDQTPYQFNELDDMSIAGTTFYKLDATAKGFVSGELYSNEFGVGLSDNYNHIHNSGSRMDTTKTSKMRVDHYDVSKSAVLDKSNYTTHRDTIFNTINEKIRTLDGGKNSKAVKDVQRAALDAMDMAEDFGDFRDIMHLMMADSDLDMNVDKMLKETLSEMGFDGVHLVARKGEDNAHNMLYMFDPELKKASRLERGKVHEFNRANETDMLDRIKAMELKEMDRFKDPTQRTDYIADPEAEAMASTPIVDQDAHILNDISQDMEALGLSDLFDDVVAKEGAQLDELQGLKASLESKEDVGIVKRITACLFKSKRGT